MATGGLGKLFKAGDVIIRQGDKGDCMYVIQEGEVEITRESDGREMRLAVAKEGDIIGEMAIFDSEDRSATVTALGEVRALTVDKKNFLRRVHEDPSIAYRVVETMAKRIRVMLADYDVYLEQGTFDATVKVSKNDPRLLDALNPDGKPTKK